MFSKVLNDEQLASTRRSFLQKLGIGAAVVSVPAGVATADAKLRSKENPALLDHFAKYETAIDLAQKAKVTAAAALAAFNARKPPLPAELIADRETRTILTHEREHDVFGNDVWPADALPRQIFTVNSLTEDTERYSSRSKIGKLARSKLAVAKQHEVAVIAAATETNVLDATVEFETACWAVQLLISGAIHADGSRARDGFGNLPAHTVEGITLKVRAADLYDELQPPGDRAYARIYIGPAVMDDVRRVLGKQAPATA